MPRNTPTNRPYPRIDVRVSSWRKERQTQLFLQLTQSRLFREKERNHIDFFHFQLKSFNPRDSIRTRSAIEQPPYYYIIRCILHGMLLVVWCSSHSREQRPHCFQEHSDCLKLLCRLNFQTFYRFQFNCSIHISLRSVPQ